MIQGLRDRQVNVVINVKLGDTDADTYRYEPMIALLSRWEKINKDKHSKHCHDQRKHISPFVFSVDRMLGREDLVVLSQSSQFNLLAQFPIPDPSPAPVPVGD